MKEEEALNKREREIEREEEREREGEGREVSWFEKLPFNYFISNSCTFPKRRQQPEEGEWNWGYTQGSQ